jgi:hypothetical protein
VEDLMKGSCLCGAVTYATTGNVRSFEFDHCSKCRKSSGSAFRAELLVAKENFAWTTGHAHIRVFEAPVVVAPPGYRRTFCEICGGPIPTVEEEFVNIPAGTLDDDPGIKPQRHIFVGVKAPWFEIFDALPRFDRK